MTAVIYGVGTSLFGRQPYLSGTRLAQAAVLEALADAGVTTVQAVYGGTVFGGPGTIQRATQTLGLVGMPILTFENACATGTTAFHEAVQAVESGRYDAVLCLGIETMTTQFRGPIVPEATDADGRSGLGMPGIYAMTASRYGALYGVDLDDLALVAVKNRAHGALNPRAQHGSTTTREEVLASRMISDPLTLQQCCDISDAAGAVIVGKPRGNPETFR